MGTDTACRISKGRSILNAQPVDCVRIVTAPDLGRIIEHSRIETSAAARASLDQHIGIALHQSLQKIIEAQDIIIQNLPLIRGGPREDIRDASVEIPFQVIHISFIQDTADTIINFINDLLPGEIQHQLISSKDRFSPRDRHCPVRMLAEEIAVFIDHLGLNPETEQQALFMNQTAQIPQLPAEFVLIYKPVSEPPEVIIPVSEPSVIHHDHFNAQALRLFRQRQNISPVKIHVEGFPAVEQDRSHPVSPAASADMRTDTVMQIAGQPGKAFRRKSHNHFRRGKDLPRLQRIGKLFLHQPQLHPGLVKLVPARTAAEAAAVNKLHGIAGSGSFRRLLIREDHHRIKLVGGMSPPASHAQFHVPDMRSLRTPLHSMASEKRDQIKTPVRKVKICAQDLFQYDFLFRNIAHKHAPGDDIRVRKNTV